MIFCLTLYFFSFFDGNSCLQTTQPRSFFKPSEFLDDFLLDPVLFFVFCLRLGEISLGSTSGFNVLFSSGTVASRFMLTSSSIISSVESQSLLSSSLLIISSFNNVSLSAETFSKCFFCFLCAAKAFSFRISLLQAIQNSSSSSSASSLSSSTLSS